MRGLAKKPPAVNDYVRVWLRAGKDVQDFYALVS